MYRQIEDTFPLEQYADLYVAGTLGSETWGTWHSNVASWIVTRGKDPNFLWLRYEDFIADTPRQLARLANFLGVHASPAQLKEAIDRSSAENMRNWKSRTQRFGQPLGIVARTFRWWASQLRAAGEKGFQNPALQRSKRPEET
jgi:hypothetical protein